ncbi:hypothetical protein QQP08_001503 [Theobroma cacao]|nr:hypothetical protein QQP08_001503 [Theobroma cacao]
MENLSRSSKASQPHSSAPLKQRRSGYEPSDTETEWHESPWHDLNRKNGTSNLAEADKFKSNLPRNISPFKLRRRHPSKVEYDKGSPPRTSPLPRRHSSKSPYKTRRDDDRNISPLSKSEHRRHLSPYNPGREEHKLSNEMGNGEIAGLNRKQNRRTPTKEERGTIGELLETGRVSGKPNYSRRSVTAPARQRGREKDQLNNLGHGQLEQRRERTPSPISMNMIRKQREASQVKQQSVGEINEMVANAKISRAPMLNAAIFESSESISPGDIFFSRDGVALTMQKNVLPNNRGVENHLLPKPPMFAQKDSASHQRTKANGNVDSKARGSSASTGLSRTTMTSSSAASRQSSGKLSTESSKMSDSSVNSGKFTYNRRKGQSEAWFACVMRGPCRTSKKSPERQAFDEASFIGKAFVVEKLRQFWADKYQPASLNGFTCHKQEAQLLKQFASHESCPHVMFKGPSGSGKRALTMAFLREIYGDPCWNVSHELRQFPIQDKRPSEVTVPLASSAHHVELNIMEVLIQIAKKEDFDLSMNFAAKIAAKSKQNLRKAIMALEACKAHNYPFSDDQPIPLGWEEVLAEVATEILSDPSQKRLFFIRGKFQKLLVDFVHPKLILQEKRLPTGTSALLKLEEFVAKFMSIYRKSCGDRQFV